MRYKIVSQNNIDKEALLKSCYRRFLVGVATLLTTLLVFVLAFPAFFRSHAGWVILVFMSLAVGVALSLRLRIKKDRIESREWQTYLWKQPVMRVVMIVMAISVIVHFYQVFFQK